MKANHDCFGKKVRDRKTSKMGYEARLFSRVEVRIRGQAALFFPKIDICWWYENVPFWTPK